MLTRNFTSGEGVEGDWFEIFSLTSLTIAVFTPPPQMETSHDFFWTFKIFFTPRCLTPVPWKMETSHGELRHCEHFVVFQKVTVSFYLFGSILVV